MRDGFLTPNAAGRTAVVHQRDCDEPGTSLGVDGRARAAYRWLAACPAARRAHVVASQITTAELANPMPDC